MLELETDQQPESSFLFVGIGEATSQEVRPDVLQLLNGSKWTIETFGEDATGRRVLATIRIKGRDVGDILIGKRLARRWPDGDEWWCQVDRWSIPAVQNTSLGTVATIRA